MQVERLARKGGPGGLPDASVSDGPNGGTALGLVGVDTNRRSFSDMSSGKKKVDFLCRHNKAIKTA